MLISGVLNLAGEEGMCPGRRNQSVVWADDRSPTNSPESRNGGTRSSAYSAVEITNDSRWAGLEGDDDPVASPEVSESERLALTASHDVVDAVLDPTQREVWMACGRTAGNDLTSVETFCAISIVGRPPGTAATYANSSGGLGIDRCDRAGEFLK